MTDMSTMRQVLLMAVFSCAVAGLCSCLSTPAPNALSKPHPFTFVQLCDTQIGYGGYEHDKKTFEQAVKQINALKPDFVVICGDLVNNPTDESVNDFNKIKAGLQVKCYCVPGNHDALPLPQARKKNVTPQESLKYYREKFGKDYFTFQHKGYTFICVNSQLWTEAVEGESIKHDLWVRSELEKAGREQSPVVIVGHHPLYVESPDEADGYFNLPTAKRKELLDLFEKHGVVAVLSGHAHRVIINDYKGIQLVTGETTSKSSPLGFRVWYLGDQRPFRHVSVPVILEGK